MAKNLVISEKLDGDGEREEPQMLARKILGNRVMGAKKVYEVFSGVWRCHHPWHVKEIKPGLFQFNFRDKFDK